MKKRLDRLKKDDYGAMFVFWGFIVMIFFGVTLLGGCTRKQPVIVQQSIEPPRAELMQESKLPAAEVSELEPLKRCVKNLANTRVACAKNADNHNGLRKYVREAVPSAKRVSVN